MNYNFATYWPNRYRRQGDTYVARGGRADSHQGQLYALAFYFAHLPTEGRVLDFGCGPGRFRPALERHGLEYEGIDLVPELGTMDVADLQPGSFECAVAIFVLQHIVDVDAYHDALRTIRRALKAGGCLLVVDHEPSAETEWAPHMRPRGPHAIACAPFERAAMLGAYDSHWIGLFHAA